MSAHRSIASSIHLAETCVRDARTLLAAGSRNAAYLAEQSLEQIVRALATSEGLHIERHDAHQLDKTLRRFPAENGMLADLRSLAWLEAYATTFRYASPSGRMPATPAPEKLSAAIGALEAIVARAGAHYGVDFTDPDAPARTAEPIRR